MCLLISSLLPSYLLSYSHISSADLRSCQLVSPHLSSSQRTLKPSHLFSRPKPAPKTDLDAKASNPYAFHREDFTQKTFTRRSFCTQQTFTLSKLSHKESCTHRTLYTQQTFTRSKVLHTANLQTQQAFRQRIFYTQKLLLTANFYTQQTFTHSKLSRKESSFTHRTFWTQLTFTHSKLAHAHPDLHRKALAHRSFYTEKPWHREACTQRSFYTQKPLHTEVFTHSKLSHREAFTQSWWSFYTQKLLHRVGEAFTHRSFYTQPASTRRSFFTRSNIKKLLHGIFYTHTPSFWIEKNLVTNDYRSLDAANPIRFPTSSYKSH